MKIIPTGYFVLVETVEVEETHQGTSILMVTDEVKREEGGRDIGYVKDIGPIAFKGFEGCNGAEDWGIKIGDLVEYNRYNGKVPRHAETDDSLKGLRIIIDSDIIAKIVENKQ